MEPLNLHLMIPEIALVVLGLFVVVFDLYLRPEKRYVAGWITAIGVAAITGYLFFLKPTNELAAQGLFRMDGFALFMKKVFGITGVLVAIMSVDYIRRYGRAQGEFFSIVIFSLAGMFLVSGVNDFMSMFVSLELVTLSFFILAAFRREDRLSGEAGIKYIIIGALAAGIMLFGMAFIYGATGQLRFGPAREAIPLLEVGPQVTLLFGLVLLLVGLGFKIASVPLHIWTPDVYQGAPTPVVAFLSVGSKAAGFVLLIRVLTLVVAGAYSRELTILFALLAGLTLFYGNLAAIPQINIKRLLGYSSIGQAGYLMLGLVAIAAAQAGQGYEMGVSAILFYLFAYVFTNLAVFMGIILLSKSTGRHHRIDDYSGLSRRSPFLALCMTIALLSLAGAPPLAGFFGKFYLITAVVEAARQPGLGWLLALVAAAGVNIVISMYYYLLVVKRIYIKEPISAEPIVIGLPVRAALIGCVLMILLIGVFPGPFVEMARNAIATMAP